MQDELMSGKFGMIDVDGKEQPGTEWADPQVAANMGALFHAWKAGGEKALENKLLEIQRARGSRSNPTPAEDGDRMPAAERLM